MKKTATVEARNTLIAQAEHRHGLWHVAAMESDAGGFVPRGVRMDAEDEAVVTVRSWSELLAPYNFTTSAEEVRVSTSGL